MPLPLWCALAAPGALLLLTLPAPIAAPRRAALPLPPPDRAGSVPLERALAARRSTRDFRTGPLTLREVGQLLWAAQGTTTSDGRRTAPSAGALYPLETLLAAARVEGLAAGLYRYDPRAHALRLEAEGNVVPALAAAALGQEAVRDAAAVVLLAGVEERTARKYGARARRYVLIEAGCAAQNAGLEAAALGLGAVVVGAFDDARIARAARLAPGEEPICLLPVGRPPS